MKRINKLMLFFLSLLKDIYFLWIPHQVPFFTLIESCTNTEHVSKVLVKPQPIISYLTLYLSSPCASNMQFLRNWNFQVKRKTKLTCNNNENHLGNPLIIKKLMVLLWRSDLFFWVGLFHDKVNNIGKISKCKMKNKTE